MGLVEEALAESFLQALLVEKEMPFKLWKRLSLRSKRACMVVPYPIRTSD